MTQDLNDPHASSDSRARRQFLLQTGFVGAAAGLGLPAWAQAAWPSRSVRLVVPFAPGGSSEIVARATAHELGKTLGQTVYVENKPGASGNIAMAEVARADDQHTLVLGHIGTLAVNPFIYDKLPYDPVKDFKPVTLLAKVPSLYVVHPDVPARNLKEFVALARSKPGRLNYGSAGTGSAGHLAMEYLKMAAELFIVHVPYRGTGPQLTVAEQGFPGFEMTQWYGLLAPANLAPAHLDRLATESAKAIRSSASAERLSADSAEAVGNTPAQFAAFIAQEQQRWKPVLNRAKVKPD